MDARTILLSLSLDLKRITTAIQRKSSAAVKFNEEADEWLKKAYALNRKSLTPILERIEDTLNKENDLEKAEDCLMYSFLIQNRALL